MTQHTPGPWEPQLRPSSEPDLVTHSGNVIVASVWGARSADDARLIAAAPDLLEACKLLLCCSLPNDVSGQAMVREARQAIAKATGETRWPSK